MACVLPLSDGQIPSQNLYTWMEPLPEFFLPAFFVYSCKIKSVILPAIPVYFCLLYGKICHLL